MRVPRPLVCVTTATSLIVLGHAAPNAVARNNGQWENSPAHIRQWFQGLRQPDNPRVSCCGEADAYEADLFEIDKDRYVAIITGMVRAIFRTGRKSPYPTTRLNGTKATPPGTASSSSASRDRFIATLPREECDRLRGLGRELVVQSLRDGGAFKKS